MLATKRVWPATAGDKAGSASPRTTRRPRKSSRNGGPAQNVRSQDAPSRRAVEKSARETPPRNSQAEIAKNPRLHNSIFGKTSFANGTSTAAPTPIQLGTNTRALKYGPKRKDSRTETLLGRKCSVLKDRNAESWPIPITPARKHPQTAHLKRAPTGTP